MDGMVIIGRRSSKSTFGANNVSMKFLLTQDSRVNTLTMFKIGFNGRGFRDMIMPFHRVLVLSDFFPLLNICFCLPHRRLRTPGLRNRQQCAYQVVQSPSILHFCLSNVSSLFNHFFTYRSPLLGDVNVGYANVCLSVKHVTYNTIPPGIGKLIMRVLYFHLGGLTCAQSLSKDANYARVQVNFNLSLSELLLLTS